jgi:hypothetical protein
MKVIILAALLGASVPAMAQDCRMVQAGALDAEVGPGGLKIPVTLDGTTEMLELRLNYADSGLSEALVTRRGFPTRRITNAEVSRDRVRILRTARVANFQIGLIKGKDVDFLMMPADTPAYPFPGDVGMAIFQDLDLEFDLSHNKVIMFTQDHCPGRAAYWTTGPVARLPITKEAIGRMTVNLTLEGKPVRALLTSVGGSSLSLAAAKRLFNLDADSLGMIASEAATIPAGLRTFKYRFKQLGFGDVILDDVEFAVLDTTPSSNSPDIVIGSSVLRRLRLFMANKENLLYATAADAH